MLVSGEMRRLVELGVSGLTSNPTIFEKAIAGGADYDESLMAASREGRDPEAVFEQLAQNLIHEGDLFGVVSTGLSSIAIDVTDDRRLLDEAAARIMGGGFNPNELIENFPPAPGGVPELRVRAQMAFNTMRDIIRSLETVQHLRKVVVYLSSGYDFNPFISERALRFGSRGATSRGDGHVDIAIRDERNGLSWLEQPADFADAWRLHVIGGLTPDRLVGFVLTDIDDDGRLDAFSGAYSQNPRDVDATDLSPSHRAGRLSWFEQPEDPTEAWTRHDVSRRVRGMFDKFLVRDMDGDGDVDLIGTRGNSIPYDGVFWLEQVRTAEPVAAFDQAREKESRQLPLRE